MVFKYTFPHFMDISTSASSVQVLKIKAGGEYVHQRCKHLFGVYKRFKLGRISVKLVPASTLPVSPGGLAYDSEDPQIVDPRDQLNPGLVRITNGENIFTDLSGLSAEVQDEMYLNTMLDGRWSKFMLQRGFKRSAIPLAYDVGNLSQTKYPDMVRNIPKTGNAGGLDYPSIDTTKREFDFVDEDDNLDKKWSFEGSDPRGLFQLGHTRRIGWLNTDSYESIPFVDSEGNIKRGNTPSLNPIPSIDCITVILPRANKTRYYYRLFISETVYFDGVKNVGNYVQDGGSMFEYRSFDNFAVVDNPHPAFPSHGSVMVPFDDGDNDGRSS